MNHYRVNSTAWSGRSGRQGNATDFWTSVTNFAHRQPEFVFAGALIGGALLAVWRKNRATAAYLPSQGERAPAPQSFTTADRRSPDPRARQPWLADQYRSRPMPSARLGATEDQMESLAAPSAHALESGTAGTTGAAYELDPKSITGG